MSHILDHYDNLAANYHQQRGMFDLSALFEDFYHSLAQPQAGLVLDLGCGAGDGFPASFLQKGWQVEGVDFSREMIKLCQLYHPQIKTTHCDLADVEITPQRYDVIESIYALFHLAHTVQIELLRKAYTGLKSGGSLYFTYATQEYTGHPRYEGSVDFMGVPLFYAHREPTALLAELQAIGFIDIEMNKHTIANETFLWVRAQRP